MRTTTGSNLRNILLQTNLLNVDELQPDTVGQIRYKEILEIDKWRISLIREIIDMKCGAIDEPEGWLLEELQDILNVVCTG